MTHVNRRSSDRETARLWRLAGLGGTMASEIIAGALLGWVLDRVFGTKPTLLIVCTILGVVVGLATFIRSALIETRRAGREATRIAATLRDPEVPNLERRRDEDPERGDR